MFAGGSQSPDATAENKTEFIPFPEKTEAAE
jgi:hypothetical protein